jgi:hypothetical protein
MSAANGGTLELNDALLAHVHKEMGQVYVDRKKWKRAATYFVLSKQTEELADCLLKIGDYMTLRELQTHCPDSSPVHKKLAPKYEAIGMCAAAVESYMKVRHRVRYILLQSCCDVHDDPRDTRSPSRILQPFSDSQCNLRAGRHGSRSRELLCSVE